MKKLIILFIFLMGYVQSIVIFANENEEGIQHIQAAFVRNNDLWILLDGREQQITDSQKVFNLKSWSYDGKWILYQIKKPSSIPSHLNQYEVWTFNIETNKHKYIMYDGFNPQWAPNRNIITFQLNNSLNISDLNRFYNVALGVGSYSWFPDGSGFLLSTSANLLPSGWTNPILYKKSLPTDYEEMNMFEIHSFYTIPKELEVGEHKIISINAGSFEFSPSGKWISFIVSPTASWSMDSNMLCVISDSGKNFQVLDEIITDIGNPKWAPTTDRLAYIAGGGRIVLGFKNKDLKVKEFPVNASLTPENYAELAFTWKDNETIITSRVTEAEWSNDPSKHPLPSLYSIDIENNIQKRITQPPNGQGDYHPQYIKNLKKIIWVRSKDIYSGKNLWIGDTDGSNAKEWLRNIDEIQIYEKP
ncbi:TolB family protein [Chengkuizengella axinellae]|uniref:TolB domain-containing protein n=1 Tax=Chengkuizengella axinellae TaxID=3064388 RepID=A0ABT9J4E0_9BACL|nr:hypothetical protein [Chengkuizengella sp. 2205SS18-9]MDP5276492.1 hypothetical protein [Chengkuizengella sp. 2205SS18-9]